MSISKRTLVLQASVVMAVYALFRETSLQVSLTRSYDSDYLYKRLQAHVGNPRPFHGDGEHWLVNEYTIRDGWPHIASKIRGLQNTSQDLKVAFLGGSVTSRSACWRRQTMDLFRSTFSNVLWTEHNAGIGGTNSKFGAFRVDRHVIQQTPDLVFVEYALNDNGHPESNIRQAMEGIVRHTKARLPQSDMVFVYSVSETIVGSYNLTTGSIPNAVRVHEEVADHYHVPTIHLGLNIVRLHEAGKVVWRGSKEPTFSSSSVLVEDVDEEFIFSADGVHPFTHTGCGE